MLIERMLSWLFPPKLPRVDEWECIREVPNHSTLDPFRPLGNWDSWAGHIKDK